MNFFDLAILILLAAFLIKGLWRGLLRELCSLAGLVCGAVLAFRFHPPLAEWLAQTLGLPLRFWTVAVFLLLFLVTVVFFALLGHLLSRFIKLIFLGGLNRVAGGVFGLAQGVVLLALVLFAVARTPLPASMESPWRDSQLSPPFVQLGEAAFQESRHWLADWR
ncbi:MAG: CvpA family protein [Desulfuromonadales bacterium]|nr:CvpA family protein [Desulfuromonadales bacterium]